MDWSAEPFTKIIKMRICHVSPYVGRQFGGPVLALSGMCDGLIKAGCEVSVASIHSKQDGPRVSFSDGVELILARGKEIPFFYYSSQLRKDIIKADCSLIHSHGLWTDVHRLAGSESKRRGVPHLIGPCGMLEPKALNRSSVKKWLVSRWFQRKTLKDASCLLANSHQEYMDIRGFGLTNPVALIPNPVTGPVSVGAVSETEFFNKHPLLQHKKLVLFLGRIHPVKGLERLIDAWNQLSSCYDKWSLVLAGPDEGGYQATIEAQTAKLNCQDSVHFIGPLDDHWKWAVLQTADLFVMPSDYENFGLAIAEAMLVGKPVITTTGTPWQVLADEYAGWWVDPTPAALKENLRKAMALSRRERQEIGARGMVIAKQFVPNKIANQLISLYKWLSNEGERPVCVRLD